MLPNKAQQKLKEREESKTMRTLVTYEDFTIDFASNDYLGLSKLAKDKQLKSENYGSGGSRLISGNYKAVTDLEAELAAFYGYESALYFNSGYQANIGLISSVPQESDLILYDELCHASIRDGMRLCFAKRKKFNHQDFHSIKELVKNEVYEDLYLITEGLFSMDGDQLNFDELAEVAISLDAKLIIDDSHGVGLSKDSELNPMSKHKIHQQLLACMIGFGKGMGAQGGVILGDSDLRNYLINFARSFVYSTAPGIAQVHLVSHQHNVLDEYGDEQREKLQKNILYLRERVKANPKFSGDENSPIQLYFDTAENLIEKQKKLWVNKIFCKAILAPTVAKGSERFRINLHSFNTQKEIDTLIEILIQ